MFDPADDEDLRLRRWDEHPVVPLYVDVLALAAVLGLVAAAVTVLVVLVSRLWL